MKAFLLILSMLLSGCSCGFFDLFKGTCFKNGLIKTIEQSTEIIVTEHSYETDFYNAESGKLKPPEIIYHKLTLTEDQKNKFVSLIKSLPDVETNKEGIQNAVSACMFEPHHTIKFYNNAELLSTMEICFVCIQVEWDSSIQKPPNAINQNLYDFITSIGLTPEQDWSALALKSIKK